MKAIASLLILCVVGLSAPASADNTRCKNGRSKNEAMWYSIAHPGLGEYYLNNWESFPKNKFWLGFIPFYGWPGYLQAVSARDAKNCDTRDNLNW